MELLYLDESGDNGLAEGSSKYYILAGISFDDYNWKENFWKIIDFRKRITQKYGIMFEELKGSELFTHRGYFFNSPLTSEEQEQIYNQAIDLISDEFHSKFFVIAKSKESFKGKFIQDKNLGKVFNQEIWTEYLAMFEEYLIKKSETTKQPQTGLIYFDSNQEKFVRKMTRQFSKKFDQQALFPGTGIVEDVIFRDSKASYFIQMADILAFSINRIITGRGKQDDFAINPKVINKLKSRIERKNFIT